MTGMEHAIERAADVIANALHDKADVDLFGGYTDTDDLNDSVLDSRYSLVAVARALADAGLLAPAPLREGGVGWYEVIHPSRATTHIAYVHEDGSIYFPEGTQVLDRHEFAFAAARGLAHRLVRACAVDPAEGDGSADQ